MGTLALDSLPRSQRTQNPRLNEPQKISAHNHHHFNYLGKMPTCFHEQNEWRDDWYLYLWCHTIGGTLWQRQTPLLEMLFLVKIFHSALPHLYFSITSLIMQYWSFLLPPTTLWLQYWAPFNWATGSSQYLSIPSNEFFISNLKDNIYNNFSNRNIFN